MKIHIGSDGKSSVTDFVIEYVRGKGHEVELHGPLKGEEQEWAEVGLEVAQAVAVEGEGILFCQSGTGVSIAANKVKGIRAALCVDAGQARTARKRNHANILVLSLRLTTVEGAKEILDAWFEEPFGTEEFDDRNVGTITSYEGSS